MKGTIIGVLALAIAGTGAAVAQQTGGGMDSHGIGAPLPGDDLPPAISGEAPPETPELQGRRYGIIDRNADGYISQQELAEHQRLLERMQEEWAQADRDGNGQVDQAEFAAFETRTLIEQQKLHREERLREQDRLREEQRTERLREQGRDRERNVQSR